MVDAKERKQLTAELGKALLKVNALKIGSFETSTGQVTPYFIDLRKLPSFPSAFSLAFQCLDQMYQEKRNSLAADLVCGVPVSGLLLSSLLAHRHQIPLVYPSKVHANSIVGLLSPGSRVLIVEDVSETGLSIKSAVQAVRSSGGIVNNALTLIDRSEGADKVLSEINVILHYFTTTEDLARTMKENMVLTDEQISALEAKAG